MSKKKLALMIKEMRAKKLSEMPINPISDVSHKRDTKVGTMPGVGSRHAPDINSFNNTVGALEKRHWQKTGNQSRLPNSYVSEEEEEELGKTDTGKKDKKNTEVVNVNPTMKDVTGGGLTTTKGLDRK